MTQEQPLWQMMQLADQMATGILHNRMMWQDPIAAFQMEAVRNELLLSRQALINRSQDPRRSIDDECGYPADIQPQDYRDLYDREPIAARVVQCMPLESWQVVPHIYEDEDVENITPFEQAWHDLSKLLRGESWYQDEEGSPIWEHLLRVDILSGIGSFGCLLFGFDDGKRLDEPVDGFVDSIYVGGSISSFYGTDAQYGAVTLMPGPEKVKYPYTVNEDYTVTNADGEIVGEYHGLGKENHLPYTIQQDSMVNNSEGKRIGFYAPNYKTPTGQQQMGRSWFALNDMIKRDQPFRDEPDTTLGPFDDNHKMSVGFGDIASSSPARSDQEAPRQDYIAQMTGEKPQQDPVDEDDARDQDPESIGTIPSNEDTKMDPNSGLQPQQVKTERRLLFLRCFDETLVYVTQYESDPSNVRFGQPVMYNITLNDPRLLHGGTGLSQTVTKVHWSRVLHVAEVYGVASEIFAHPRMMPVYNRVLDLKKLHGGSAEMYWRGAFAGYSLETHPTLGGDVQFDPNDIKDNMEQYMNGLQRYIAIAGAHMNSLAPQVVDPTPQIAVQIESICIRLAIPKRVFMGSERGELASTQDDQTWNDRLKQRQNMYLTPRIIIPFIDRLIKVGVLPEPMGYSIVWPDLNSASELEKAQIANQLAQALSTFVSGGIEQIMDLADFLVRIMKMDEQEAHEIVTKLSERSDADLLTQDPQMDQEFHDATIEQMTNPDLVPDNIQTGDQHHYEAGSMDRQAELDHDMQLKQMDMGAGGPGGANPQTPGAESGMPQGAMGQGGNKPPAGKGKLPKSGAGGPAAGKKPQRPGRM